MKYTTNYNLYKPDYDDTIDVDFLNKNMDVLDTQINGLDYVQNVNTSDNGLTFIKRNGDTIPVSLNYLPITGGNTTGDVTILGKLIPYVIEDIRDDSNPDWTLRAIKYNDGTLKNIITLKTNISTKTISFLIPFISTEDIIVHVARLAVTGGGTGQENMYTVAKLTNTSFETANGANTSRQQTTLIGRWK